MDGKTHIDEKDDGRRIGKTKFDQTAMSWLKTHEHHPRKVKITEVAGQAGDISTGKRMK